MRAISLLLLALVMGCSKAETPPSYRPESPAPPLAATAAGEGAGPAAAGEELDEASLAQWTLPGAPAPTTALVRAMANGIASTASHPALRPHHRRADGTPRYTNRLILESSPYLLQHAHTPVDWHPWGDEAFALAKTLNRPILLSIGYSTCHWCHVMERESFEDEQIARTINSLYVAIKVDSEEHPGVDALYMEAVQRLSGKSGWPITCWVTPDRLPFFGGTYFPAKDGERGFDKGLRTLLVDMEAAFRTDPTTIVQRAEGIARAIEEAEARSQGENLPSLQSISATSAAFLEIFDDSHGGFGQPPKFPRPAALDLLLRYARRAESPIEPRKMVYLTLIAMSSGGIYDHIGQGFFRYAVDAAWKVPHFEKMLYDNAQLIALYSDAYQFTGEQRFREIAKETAEFLLRDLRGDDGLFFSAFDAEAGGREGSFATWTPAQVQAAVGAELAPIATNYYGIAEVGPIDGANVPFVSGPIEAMAPKLGIEAAEAAGMLALVRAKMLAARRERPAPLRDEKRIAAWNAMAIAALARAGTQLGETPLVEAAERAGRALLPPGKEAELRRIAGDPKSPQAVLDDYAWATTAALELVNAGLGPEWLERAIALQAATDAAFFDAESGLYFLVAKGTPGLFAQQRPSYDGAMPSGNAVVARNLLRLCQLTLDDEYRTRADGILRGFTQELARGSTDVPAVTAALEMRFDWAPQIVIARPAGQSDEPLMAVVRKQYLPNAALLRYEEGPGAEAWARALPWVKGKLAPSRRPTAYVCERGACQRPTDQPDELRSFLKRVATIQP